MTKLDHYFTCLSEEAAEIIQATSKCLRFGEKDGYPNTNRTNITDLTNEINDVLAVVELLSENGIFFEGLFDRKAIDAKKERVKKWLLHSEKMGRLSAQTRGELNDNQ